MGRAKVTRTKHEIILDKETRAWIDDNWEEIQKLAGIRAAGNGLRGLLSNQIAGTAIIGIILGYLGIKFLPGVAGQVQGMWDQHVTSGFNEGQEIRKNLRRGWLRLKASIDRPLLGEDRYNNILHAIDAGRYDEGKGEPWEYDQIASGGGWNAETGCPNDWIAFTYKNRGTCINPNLGNQGVEDAKQAFKEEVDATVP